MKNQIKVISVIIGTLIGAGFASGQELYLFFGSYGIKGFFGVLLSIFLTSVLIYQVFHFLDCFSIHNYSDFLNLLLPDKYGKSRKKVRLIFHVLVQLFLFVSFFIMVAGFGAYFKQEFNIPSLFGCIIIAILCYFTFIRKSEGLVKVNTLLIPSLILFTFLFGIQNIPFLQHRDLSSYLISTNTGSFILDSLLYAGYNSILLVPILITLKSYLHKKRDALTISLGVFCFLTLLAITILTLLFRIPSGIDSLEIPMMYVASSLGIIQSYLYGIIILVAIFTSAISAGHALLENVSSSRHYLMITFILCFLSIFIANIGFSDLVSTLYPLFGYLGIIQISMILLKKKGKTDIN